VGIIAITDTKVIRIHIDFDFLVKQLNIPREVVREGRLEFDSEGLVIFVGHPNLPTVEGGHMIPSGDLIQNSEYNAEGYPYKTTTYVKLHDGTEIKLGVVEA
jgi:hypothetical protein